MTPESNNSLRLTDEQRSRADEHIGLLFHIARKRANRYRNTSETVQIGAMGLISAASHFDETKGVEFHSYASECIHNAITNSNRVEYNRNKPESLDEIKEMIGFEPLSPDSQPPFLNDEDFKNLKAAINWLRPSAKYVIQRTELDGATCKTVARELNFTISRVAGIKKRAMRKLKEVIVKHYQD